MLVLAVFSAIGWLTAFLVRFVFSVNFTWLQGMVLQALVIILGGYFTANAQLASVGGK